MNGHRHLKQLIILFILGFYFSNAQDTDPPKPKFPDVFQVEVQGILRDEKIEVDGSLYYDRVTNRAALHYKHQNEFSITIYNFNDSQMMFIKDFECTVSDIPETGSFFPYSTTGTKKILSPAEEFFYFTNSVFDREEESLFPSYVFKDTINATQYGLFNCQIFHVFSKPELVLPDCDSYTCKTTMISVSLKCPSPVKGEEDIHHSYDFFRFKSRIIEENVFQPPVGVHCKTKSHKAFPEFPPYYSFSYNLINEQVETESMDRSVFTTYKKVWHDTELKLIRVDAFDHQGLTQETRILDFYGKLAYTIVARIPVCQPSFLQENFAIYDITLLPRIFFNRELADNENVVYIGKREVHGMDFDVWTLNYEIKDSQTVIVREFYFSNNAPDDDDETESNSFQISHVNAYTYEKGNEKYGLVGQTYLSISNFRSKQKEWEAFDVSSCYAMSQKKNFQLRVEGPPMVKSSFEYEEVLENLYGKIMNETSVSVIRINQLKGTFDGMYLNGFFGWILEKFELDGTEINNNEPDMRETIKLISLAASTGKLDIAITRFEEEKKYKITPLTDIIIEKDPPKPKFPDVFQVEFQGIFHKQQREIDGSIFFDRLNNRAMISYTDQNITTTSIYDFNSSQLIYIKDVDCAVSEIRDTATTFFPFTVEETTKKKVISSPEELFYFTKSKYDRTDESIVPSYIFVAVQHIPLYGLSNCEINHIFSKPAVELPDCNNHTCRPSLMSILVKCPQIIDTQDQVFHTYNFYKFRPQIKDVSVFHPPVGVHCKVPSEKPFPDFPEYYSFSYDIFEEQRNSNGRADEIFKQLRIWHDTKLKLVRIDEFSEKGYIEGTRIFDLNAKVLYTITAPLPDCTPMHLTQSTPLESITSLPKIFFAKTAEEKSTASFVGIRTVNGIDYVVWSQTYNDALTNAKIVQEFYFNEVHIPESQKEKNYLRISHVDEYTYQMNRNSGKEELIGQKFIQISNFRSSPKEWEAFDVSPCYVAAQKKSFQLQVQGPPMLKNSFEYEELLEELYNLIKDETSISVVRINQLVGKFDGIYLTELSGWILGKIETNGSEVNKNEPDMKEAITAIVNAANFGKFDVSIDMNNEKKTYQIISKMSIIPEKEPPKPKFPDIFQVDVQGIFYSKKREMDGSIAYDRLNNRAVMSYTYQNETTTSIFDFNNNKLLYIEDVNCRVMEITDYSRSFFPYTIDENTKKKIISSPEELFFFTKSKFDRQELSVFPSYIYTSVQDIPLYELTKCEVNHIFSKPEVEQPDCDSHTCRPTLVSINVNCPPRKGEVKKVSITYNFYRFRSQIKDVRVFQPPLGVHCQVPSNKTFPDFPEYYSFSYDVEHISRNSATRTVVKAKHRKIWHDKKLSLVRMDEFGEDGFLDGTRIFDFYGRVSYTITALSPNCTPEFLKRNTPLESLTPLPKIFFAKTPEEKSSASYIGKRTINGIDYETWTQTHDDEETNAKIVEEFYFIEKIPEGQENDKKYLRISHVDKYTYQTNKKTGEDELSSTEYLDIINFRSGIREWEAFDVASCFKGEQKKGFRLKVEGPPLVKSSYMYENLLENLYSKLIKLTNASLVRISELQGNFDGVYIKEFSGWILNKLQLNESIKLNKEPDMHKAYELIEKAGAEGKLTIELDKDQVYKVTEITDINKKTGSCTSGGVIAAIAIVTLLIGAVIGVVGYYAFQRNFQRSQEGDGIALQHVK